MANGEQYERLRRYVSQAINHTINKSNYVKYLNKKDAVGDIWTVTSVFKELKPFEDSLGKDIDEWNKDDVCVAIKEFNPSLALRVIEVLADYYAYTLSDTRDEVLSIDLEYLFEGKVTPFISHQQFDELLQKIEEKEVNQETKVYEMALLILTYYGVSLNDLPRYTLLDMEQGLHLIEPMDPKYIPILQRASRVSEYKFKSNSHKIWRLKGSADVIVKSNSEKIDSSKITFGRIFSKIRSLYNDNKKITPTTLEVSHRIHLFVKESILIGIPLDKALFYNKNLSTYNELDELSKKYGFVWRIIQSKYAFIIKRELNEQKRG